MSVSRWPRNHVAILVGDHQIERVTRRTGSHGLRPHRIDSRERLGDGGVLALERGLSALIGPPRVHQAILRHRAQIQAVWLEEYGLCATSVSRMTTSLDAAESTELLGVPCQLR